MTDVIKISALKAGRAIALGTVGLAAMAMAPAPALANASASASADVKAPVRENAERGESDAKFKQLFATWKKSEAQQAKVGIATPATTSATVASIPSRLPVEGSRYSSSFGSRIHPVTGRRKNHDGLDMAAPTGTPIYATADGRVEMAQWYGGYGNYVQIEHGGDIETRYGHMSRMNVRPDQEVKKGDLIGWVGSTGRSTGPHLHYEVRIAGEPVDPEPYLNRDTFQQAFADANGLGAGGPED